MEDKKITDAKSVSKIAMIIAVIFLIVYNLIYVILSKKIPTVEEQKSILLFCGAIIIFFTPVYLNLIMDKIVDIFKKDKSE
jgi:uncharacterized membrane protein YagU involved in acid resistance